MARLLPRLALLATALCCIAVIGWGCTPKSAGSPCEHDRGCSGGLPHEYGVCMPNRRCAPYCREPAAADPDPCPLGFFCDGTRASGQEGLCIQCDDDHPCASGTCDGAGFCKCESDADCPIEQPNCDATGACVESLLSGPLGLPTPPFPVTRTPAPPFAASPDPHITLSTLEPGEHPALTLSYDFTAGELRTHYASLFLPGAFGVDLTPPLTCAADDDCPGGTCVGSKCEPLSCVGDPDCPDFGVPGENDLPGFCFTPFAGAPASCRVSCSSTPSSPVGGSCPGVDDCPAGTTCTVLDDQTCGCAPPPEVGRGLGALGLDFGINGSIDLLAPVLSYDDHTAFIDLDGDASIEGEPMLLHRDATAILAHRLAIFVPPADDPLNPQPLVPQSTRTYLILEAGPITNPANGGAFTAELELHSVDPESGGFDDGSGLAPQRVTVTTPLVIQSPIFGDGFESGDASAWTVHRP